MKRKDALEQIVFHLLNPMPPLKNGATMLCAATKDEDSYAIVALNPKGKGHEYVVWTMLSDGTCVWGHYFENLEDALDYFVGATTPEKVAA